jgi:hypothetical protein
MKRLTIIGKNSQYYNRIKIVLKQFYHVIEYSHRDILNSDIDIITDSILLICRIQEPEFLDILNEKIKTNTKILLISSVILDLPKQYFLYNYYREKKNIETHFINKLYNTNSKYIIRSGNITKDDFIFSYVDDVIFLINYYLDTSNAKIPNQIMSTNIFIKDFYEFKPTFYHILFNIKYAYIFLRPLDIFYKYRHNFLYGYSYALYKHVIK